MRYSTCNQSLGNWASASMDEFDKRLSGNFSQACIPCGALRDPVLFGRYSYAAGAAAAADLTISDAVGTFTV